MKKLAATLAALGLAGVLVGFTATPDSAPKPVAGSSWASIPDLHDLLQDLL